MMYKVKIPIYNGTLHICIGNNINKKAKEYFNIVFKSPETIKECLAICTKIDYLNYVIFLTKKGAKKIGTIAHESKHFVNYVFEDRGIKLSKKNDEAECYFLTWAIEEIEKAIKKYG